MLPVTRQHRPSSSRLERRDDQWVLRRQGLQVKIVRPTWPQCRWAIAQHLFAILDATDLLHDGGRPPLDVLCVYVLEAHLFETVREIREQMAVEAAERHQQLNERLAGERPAIC